MMVTHGITGNLYAFSSSLSEIRLVCDKIGKSKNSIYWNERYKFWVIRMKSKKHKKKIQLI